MEAIPMYIILNSNSNFSLHPSSNISQLAN